MTREDFSGLKSFFIGGFECSTHRLASGKRLDVIAATRQEEFALPDYQRLSQQGLRVAREGLRWHLVERIAGQYDFASAFPIVRAAQTTGKQVIWDLCHFGWPDHLDVFKPEFVTALARYAAAFARWLNDETGAPGWFVPVNEISFFSWAAGEDGSMFPFARGRGLELKTQLVRGAIESMESIWAILPAARFAHVDPVIHVVGAINLPPEHAEAEACRQSQFEAWDMLSGRSYPELGGHEKYLGFIGLNFYPYNEWFHNYQVSGRSGESPTISRRSLWYRPFRELLKEVYERYHCPVFIAETGAEDGLRASWLRYMCRETSAAMSVGVPVQGICLYPILNHPGWDDDRHCCNGLWDYADETGDRELYLPLAKELRRWQCFFEPARPVLPEAVAEKEPVRA